MNHYKAAGTKSQEKLFLKQKKGIDKDASGMYYYATGRKQCARGKKRASNDLAVLIVEFGVSSAERFVMNFVKTVTVTAVITGSVRAFRIGIVLPGKKPAEKIPTIARVVKIVPSMKSTPFFIDFLHFDPMSEEIENEDGDIQDADKENLAAGESGGKENKAAEIGEPVQPRKVNVLPGKGIIGTRCGLQADNEGAKADKISKIRIERNFENQIHIFEKWNVRIFDAKHENADKPAGAAEERGKNGALFGTEDHKKNYGCNYDIKPDKRFGAAGM